MDLISPAFDCRYGIDYAQAPILMTVPIEPYAAPLLFDDVLDEPHHRARSIRSRVAHRVANTNGLCPAANGGRVKCSKGFRSRSGRVFSDIHHWQAFTYSKSHSLFRELEQLFQRPVLGEESIQRVSSARL